MDKHRGDIDAIKKMRLSPYSKNKFIYAGSIFQKLMHAARDDRQKPLSYAEVISFKNKIIDSHHNTKNKLIERVLLDFIDTGDGIVYRGKKFKIVYKASQFLMLNENTKLRYGALELSNKEYENLAGPEFFRISYENCEYAVLENKLTKNDLISKKKLQALNATPIRKMLTMQEVLGSDLHLALAGYDFRKRRNSKTNSTACKKLEEYAKHVFKIIKNNLKENTAMGVFLAKSQGVPTLRNWFIGSLRHKFDVNGNFSLFCESRLICS